MNKYEIFTHWKFKHWQEQVEKANCQLESVSVRYVVQKNETDFYSAFLECVLITAEGARMHRGLTLRGPSVAIIPLIEVEGYSLFQTLAVRQRRIADGHFSIEFPAGGIEEKQSAEAAAVQELREEIGLVIAQSQLIPLTESPLLTLTSAFDETVAWFAVKLKMTPEAYRSYDGKKTGLREDGELITVQTVSLSDMEAAANYQPLVGLSLLRKKHLL